MVDDLPAQGAKRGQLFRGQAARFPIHDAQGAQRVAVGRDQGCSGVKADAWFTCHERVVRKAMVGLCIADFEYFIRMQDGMGAEGDSARCFGGVDADG